MNEATTKCPQCESEDDFCLYCGGCGKVTIVSCAEWHRQNFYEPGGSFNDSEGYPPREITDAERRRNS